MFGRKRQRLAQAQLPGLDQAGLRRLPLGLVGGEDHGAAGAAQDVGEDPVIGGDTRARVDQEEARVGHLHRAFAEAAHAALQAVVGGILQPGGVDHGEAQGAQPRLALAQVAGHAGLVVDQREFPADEPVEQGRLAHVGASDDGEGEAHGCRSVAKPPP
jgi:hypothetical protein